MVKIAKTASLVMGISLIVALVLFLLSLIVYWQNLIPYAWISHTLSWCCWCPSALLALLGAGAFVVLLLSAHIQKLMDGKKGKEAGGTDREKNNGKKDTDIGSDDNEHTEKPAEGEDAADGWDREGEGAEGKGAGAEGKGAEHEAADDSGEEHPATEHAAAATNATDDSGEEHPAMEHAAAATEAADEGHADTVPEKP